MQAGSRKNMDRMAEVVPDSKSRNLQQFLTHSKWSHREVIDHVAMMRMHFWGILVILAFW